MMDANFGSGGGADEDTSRARENMRNARENRDALAAENGGTAGEMENRAIAGPASPDATRADAAGRPDDVAATGSAAPAGPGTGTGSVSDDAARARENVRAAGENRDALAEQNRRVEGTIPPGIATSGG